MFKLIKRLTGQAPEPPRLPPPPPPDAIPDNPLEAHANEVVKALSLGVAAVYGVDVDGDIAEFGTMTGSSAVGLARAMERCDRHLGYAIKHAGTKIKDLHLFDSFVGLPKAENPVDASSPHVRSGVWNPGTCVGLTRDELFGRVTQYMQPARVRIFEGWFSETLKTIPAGTKYSLVHIDSDLYSSAIEVLDYLFANEMIAEGTLFFFDDWNCNRGSPQFGERRAWRECVAKYQIDFSDEGSYGLFSHKFLVHGYARNTVGIRA